MSVLLPKYDVIVVGAGHAGCEAANAAAKLGSSVLLVTMNMNLMAQMSCNPSIGGVAKGQIVREIDALGGMTGLVTDKTMIQFRMLNRSKGPAMWSPRAQCDRMMFSLEWRNTLERNRNIDFWQDDVVELIVEKNKVIGVKTAMEIEIFCQAVILANGTFLNGLIHIGEKSFGGGRMGENPSKGIPEQLKELGFETSRLKTGTPVRVDGRTIDFSKLEEQKGDEFPEKFSFDSTPKLTHQKSCYLAYTSLEVHEILKSGFEKSPLFQGMIKGRGPRYCPSIEDKIVRFSDKIKHQLFVEPEGWDTIEYYINGFSSSLPEEVQLTALRRIVGFENVRIFRPGYAIEYDFFPPSQLKNTLETKEIGNLYFAGQINGTTGYEEAAAQGLMAGINAHRKIHNLEKFVLSRSEAYIGVLIDDLITKSIDEPYRMFTSRAEFRILLRQDNADLRLTPKGKELGLISEERWLKFIEKTEKITKVIIYCENQTVTPEEINSFLTANESAQIIQKTKLKNLLLRPQISIGQFKNDLSFFSEFLKEEKILESEILEEAEIQIKYSSYIEKEKELVERMQRFENIVLHPDFDYGKINALSIEAREKLSKIKPETIGQAMKISGVSPADITVLLVFLGR